MLNNVNNCSKMEGFQHKLKLLVFISLLIFLLLPDNRASASEAADLTPASCHERVGACFWVPAV